MHKSIITLLCAAGLIFSSPAMAENLKVKPGAPARYTVKKGDTLWGISGKYLYRPWKWPSLWRANRNQIRNPHLIYPGQVLVLSYVNGQPVLGLEGIPTVKLGPKIRELDTGYGISTLNVDFYRMFMKSPQFMNDDQLKHAPRLVAGRDGRVMYGTGDRVYADGVPEDGSYLVFRVNRDLKDPETGKYMGKLVEFSGEVATLAAPNADNALSYRRAEWEQQLSEDEYYKETNGRRYIVRTAQPMVVVNAVSEIRAGDYLLKKPDNFGQFNIMPHEPENKIYARIVGVMDGIAESGAMQTIILNKGEADGLDKGSVLSLYRRGKVVKSQYRVPNTDPSYKRTDYVNTPVEEIGLAMVYHTGEHVSSAIILESIANVNIEDLASNPGQDLEVFGRSAKPGMIK